MWKHKFEMELIFTDEQMEIILESYKKQEVVEELSVTLEEFVETLAQMGVCMTLLQIAQNL